MNRYMSLFNIKKILDYRNISRLTAEGKEIPKQKQYENRVTLINTDNSVSITDLKNAQSLSVRRELKLVKIQDVDSKTRRPVYKLMTNTEYHAEELNKRKEKQASRQNDTTKGEKLLTLSSRIGDHDLITGIKKIIKLLGKHYEVKVIITGDGVMSEQNLDRIYSVIENNVKDSGKIVQKRNKGNALKFQLLPIKQNSSQATIITTLTANDEDDSLVIDVNSTID
ncbi:hypothetical protein K1T71_005077 [Dendrolimus kikuchii]|uniref:Uncharacterized protein n=1 Tax=Dendrolimus kikuchii TaxID=765133 RepID=A0ACC1D6C7_9NEOP|nr:hypothetical protein K1T71_005077 [Dendrolimus kikuchii]